MRFQLKKKAQMGFVIIPREIWIRKGWIQGTRLFVTEAIDGSLIIRESRRQY